MDFQVRSKLLGEYQLGKTIGQGAFSKVKLGYHRETGQKVAIKIVDKKMMAEKARKSKEAHEERERRMKAKDKKKGSDDDRGHKGERPSSIQKENASHAEDIKKQDSEESKMATQYPQMQEENSLGNPIPASDLLPDFVSKLQLEVQLMLRLEHPNIVKVYQVIDSEDECFIVMEYAKGGELIEYIASRDHLSEKEARRFFRQIVSAIDHCHLANVVHRDLKLENLLLNGEKNILLSDFGLGRTFRDDLEEYMKTFCGTPNYAAVELISGIPYVGVKSDIWAMGVVLYLMVTGKPPFYGDTISLLYKEIKAVNYKVYDSFSKELRHLLSRMLCKDPVQRIDMAELRLHPWVNLEESEPPPRHHPRISGNVEPAVLNQFIKGIHYEKGSTIYVFREHKKEEGKKMFAGWSKDTTKEKAIKTDVEKEEVKGPTPPPPKETAMVPEPPNTVKKSSTFQLPTFLRRISFSAADRDPNRRSSVVDSNRNSVGTTEAPKGNPKTPAPVSSQKVSVPVVTAEEPSTNEEIQTPVAPLRPAAKVGPVSLVPPADAPTIIRRHSGIGAALSIPEDQLIKMRRASGSGLPSTFGKTPLGPIQPGHQGPATIMEQRENKPMQKAMSLGFQLMPAISALLKKSSTTINSGELSQTTSNTRGTNGSDLHVSNTISSPASIKVPQSRFKRSSTFTSGAQAPVIQLESEHNSDGEPSPMHSPLPPSASSIRSIRRASHSPTLEKRESFGAIKESDADSPRQAFKVRGPSLAIPGDHDFPRRLGLGVPGKTDVSKSHHAFNSNTESSKPATLSAHGHNELARSAILAGSGLAQQADDEEKLGTTFGSSRDNAMMSHDMMSVTSRWTDQDESVMGSGSNGDTEPSAKEIQEWHELHLPPKVVRSMRFSFNTATSSTLEPNVIFKRLHQVLILLSKRYDGAFMYHRPDPDYYLITCRLMNRRDESEGPLIFEVEVCKVWLLKLHGLRIKRMGGNPLLFKEIYGFIESELKI